MSLLPFMALLAFLPSIAAQQGAYAQCGGTGWTGGTTCISGYACTYSNAYYSQCLPTSASTGTTTHASSSSTSATGTSTSTSPGATSTALLDTLAKSFGKKYFGTATDNPELTDTAYVAILDQSGMFGQLTPANSMKWDATEPERGTFTFTDGDQIVALAQSNGQVMRGHNCVWYNQLPSWVTAGNFNATTLTSIIQTHCATLVSHYKGEIYSWDVINEPFDDSGDWRTDVFYNTLGTSYVSIALQAARSADPNAKLYINDYNIESAGAKATAMQNLVQSLKSADIPIDGVGLQGHFIVGEVPSSSSLQSNLEAFTALGVEVAFTELDIRMTLPATTALLAQQKADYETVAAACKAVSGCVGVTLWDYTDKYSWVPSTFSGQGEACPWDANLVKKPAYDGTVIGLQS